MNTRCTLNTDWHKKREAEPKDYDFTLCNGKNKMHISTYKRLGMCLDAEWLTTAQMYQDHSKKECNVRETPKLMVQVDNCNSLVFNRISGPLRISCTSVLPCHPPGYSHRELGSTYKMDYLPPRSKALKCSQSYLMTKCPTIQTDTHMERKVDFRRRQSQFTDVADYRRWGQNTWQDVNKPMDTAKEAGKSLYRNRYSA